MTDDLSRREALQTTAAVAGASLFAAMGDTNVHAGESNTIQIALVGCGGRGTGAAVNALSVKYGPVKLVAMADVFADRLKTSATVLSKKKSLADKIDVPEERKFVGFDGYKKAMDSLKKNDVVILATPVAFRWPMFQYAIEKGLHVFMEKPVTVDGPSTRKFLELVDQSEKTSQKVAVGLMCRHCDIRRELARRIHDGAIGDVTMLRAYRMAGPTASAFSLPKPEGISEVAYQIQRFHSFLWASGGAFSDFLIHNIDEACWMKDAWPIEAQASGGRHYRGKYVDQNFDTYSVEYTFGDGAKLFLEGRTMEGAKQQFATYAHGTKGSAVVSAAGHLPALSRIYKGQKFVDGDIVWKGATPEPDPYQLEWEHFIEAIRKDEKYNEARRGAEASLVTAMGRMAAHTGQVIKRDQILNCDHDFAPNVDKLTMDGPAPLQADKDGKYPVPQPGIVTKREF